MAERPPITDDRARQFYVYATAWDMGSEPSPGAQQARSINANEWDAWLAAHDARVHREGAREALDGLTGHSERLAEAGLLGAGTAKIQRAAAVIATEYRDTYYPEKED